MKLTLLGDTHTTRDSMSKVSQLLQKVQQLGNDVIYLGDQFDTKSVIYGPSQNLWWRHLNGSPEIHHYLIKGNHDDFDAQGTDHALRLFENLENVTVVDKPTVIPHTNVNLIPYMRDQKELKKILKKLPMDSDLMAHLDIAGFDYGNGRLHQGGMNLRALSRFRRVISGHYHKYQNKGNLTYLGTGYSKDFGESDQEKYMGVYDTETNDLELIPTHLPQHRTLTIKCDGKIPLGAYLPVPSILHIYRIILTGSRENINNVDLKDYFEEDFLTLNKPKIIPRPNELRVKKLAVLDTDTPQQQFTKWAKNVSDLSPEATKTALEIIKELA